MGLKQSYAIILHKIGVEVFEPEDIPGLSVAYKNGYLHATSTRGEGINLYYFPSLLHHRYVFGYPSYFPLDNFSY